MLFQSPPRVEDTLTEKEDAYPELGQFEIKGDNKVHTDIVHWFLVKPILANIAKLARNLIGHRGQTAGEMLYQSWVLVLFLFH